MSTRIPVFVEGRQDAVWARDLLERAFPQAEVVFDVISSGGKASAISRFAGAWQAGRNEFPGILLVDADTPYINDARNSVLRAFHQTIEAAGPQQVTDAISECIFFAIPTIESWFFADTDALLECGARRDLVNFDRIYFPDEIPEPKHLAVRLLGGRDLLTVGRRIINRMELGVAVTRSPSLRDFLRGVGKLIGDKRFESLPDANRALGKRLLVSLLQETNRSDAVIYRTLKGEELTVAQLIEAIRQESPVASEYASDLLRVARDQLAREAKRKIK